MSADAVDRIAEIHRDHLAWLRRERRISLWVYVRRLSWVDAWQERWQDKLAGRYA